jgi:uncharacterized membrane protein
VYHQSFLFSTDIQSSKSKLDILSIVNHLVRILLGDVSLIHFLNISSACFLASMEYQFGNLVDTFGKNFVKSVIISIKKVIVLN